MNLFKQPMADLLGLIFPEMCITCGQRLVSQEKLVCFNCWQDLPVTNFHLHNENKVEKLFWGRVNIFRATAFFSFKKGSKYQKLIHYLKYKGLKELGFETGQRFGHQLKDSADFAGVDLIIPVPLHPLKQKKRGYNQSYWIALGIAAVLQKPVDDKNLYRQVNTSTQTRRNRFERWQNVEKVFALHNPESLCGKHILLIDDVVTTGATIEACAIHCLNVENTKVSVASLAYADV